MLAIVITIGQNDRHHQDANYGNVRPGMHRSFLGICQHLVYILIHEYLETIKYLMILWTLRFEQFEIFTWIEENYSF